jgi:hypothetical protein
MPHHLEISQKSKAERIKWLLRNGTPWFLKRSVDLLPAALVLIIYEFIKVVAEKVNPKIKAKELAFLTKIESDHKNIELLKAS